jgi:benzoyl-CoA reductase/2-hydroxyglutaryl-CoA dehydratase subunit BcrC/BadD/HgdB
MKLCNITEATYAGGGSLETAFALYNTHTKRFYQYSSVHPAGFRSRESFRGGVTFFRTIEEAHNEISELKERIEARLAEATKEGAARARINKINRALVNVNYFRVVQIDAMVL